MQGLMNLWGGAGDRLAREEDGFRVKSSLLFKNEATGEVREIKGGVFIQKERVAQTLRDAWKSATTAENLMLRYINTGFSAGKQDIARTEKMSALMAEASLGLGGERVGLFLDRILSLMTKPKLAEGADKNIKFSAILKTGSLDSSDGFRGKEVVFHRFGQRVDMDPALGGNGEEFLFLLYQKMVDGIVLYGMDKINGDTPIEQKDGDIVQRIGVHTEGLLAGERVEDFKKAQRVERCFKVSSCIIKLEPIILFLVFFVMVFKVIMVILESRRLYNN